MGTCTFRPEAHEALLTRAQQACAAVNMDWETLPPHERFAFLQRGARHEVQKYWKRLRREGMSFKYLAVFEEDSSGRPHMHCLLHETDAARPIHKRELGEGWNLGFSNFRLLRLGLEGELPYGAVAYVTMSLAKQRDTRLCASTDYRQNGSCRSQSDPNNLSSASAKSGRDRPR